MYPDDSIELLQLDLPDVCELWKQTTARQNQAAIQRLWLAYRGGQILAEDPELGSGKKRKLSFYGIDDNVSSRWQRIYRFGQSALEQYIATADEATISGCLQEIDRLEKEASVAESRARRDRSRSAEPLPDGMDLRIGDARDVLTDVADDSVALVLTDPPYVPEADPLWEWMAEWSARVLVPGGSLISFTAHARLDRDFQVMSQHLRYWWLLARLQDSPAQVPGRFVIAEYKPVVWFVKDHRRGRSMVTDVIRAQRDPNIKELHDWAQSTDGLNFLIEHLTEPGELIADPFAGTGRWGELAASMGRRWIGADVVAGGAAEVVV